MIPVQLEYAAPAGCPTQAEFVASVASRGGDFTQPGPSAKARAMTVSLRREGSEHTGSLELRLDETASDARQLRGQTCAEVAEALAVVAAIALRGADQPPEVAKAATTPSTGTTPTTPVPAAAPAPLARAPRHETRLRTVGFWGNESVPVTAGPLQVNRSLSATLAGGVVVGAIPSVVMPRYDLTLSRANFITTPSGDNYLIGSVLGVRWSLLGPATHESGSYSTDMYGFLAGVRSCSSLTYDTRGFVALFCGSFMVGVMTLETQDADSDYEQSKEIGQGAAALELDTRYHLGQYVHLSATLSGELRLGELSAERADGSEVFHSRLFNANALLGIGVQF